MLKAAQAYVQTQVTTTNQGNILLLLYDGAIKFLKQAKSRIEEKNYAQKGILISKAMDVIAELDSSLNSQKGGELAENLHRLYFLCNTKLLQANLHMKTELIDEVVGILEGLRSAFAEAMNSPAAQQPQSGEQQNANQRPTQQQPAFGAKAPPKAGLGLNIPQPQAAKPAEQSQAPQQSQHQSQEQQQPQEQQQTQQTYQNYGKPAPNNVSQMPNPQQSVSRSRLNTGASAYRRMADHVKS